MKKELNEYFSYIKTIYLNEYQKYLNEQTKEYIKSLNDVVEINEDLTFKISVEKKIIFNLDIDKFIEENKLYDENNLCDINEDGKNYIQFLIKNKDDIYEIIKRKFLRQSLKLLISNKCDALISGCIDTIQNELGIKYNLKQDNFIKSKEVTVFNYIKKIVGDKIILSGILNNNLKEIEENYNLYIEDQNLESFNQLMEEFNKSYNNYYKKIGKVFLTDSLYEYQILDYQIDEKTGLITNEKRNNNIEKVKRLISIRKSLVDISKYRLLFDHMEIINIKNDIAEMDKILNKIREKGNVLENIDSEYNKAMEIEEDAKKYSYKVWNNEITSINYYRPDNFLILIGSHENEKTIETVLISNEHLKNLKTMKYSYGFIYGINKDSVIYSATSNIICKEINDPLYKPNYNTIKHNDILLDVDIQETSKIITPRLIIEENMKAKEIRNKVILDKSNTKKIGVYCFLEDDIENSSNYARALELSENYNLPVFKIEQIKQNIEPIKIDIKMTEQEVKKESIFDKIRKTKDKILYEDEINDFKKTL